MLATLTPVLSGVGVAPATNSYFSIATTTVGSGGASSITFSSIPSTYTHLQIRGIGLSNRASYIDNYLLQLNGDTGNNYSYHQLYGDGTNVGTGNAANNNGINTTQNIPSSSYVSNVFGVSLVDILDYTNTNKYKTIRLLSGVNTNTSADASGNTGRIQLDSGLWMNTAVVTSLTFTLNFGAWQQYSSFALYGVK
jgi:hypothetical protein